ncbi:hypothetical protein MKW92_025031 [Papaver armeniacum]|nr:hypothetical protein MKW92_025031 [Papaver armeniacum]
MAIFATLPGLNLFSPPPSNPRLPSPSDPTPKPSTPIPIPRYPKPLKSQKSITKQPPNESTSPAFKTFHRRTKYYKPVSDGVISSEGDRSVIIGESGVSYLLPGAPFEFQFSYSETPKVKPLAIREPAFLPFAPPTMPRPWTGKAPLKKSKKNIPLFDSFNPPPVGMKGVKQRRFWERLTREEVRMLVKPHLSHNRQVNLGRDGLTHNMLELIHEHWKRQRICKVRCRGVPTVDMDNVCYHLEEKTGGKIIHRVGGVLYLFRGRNYNYRTRPQYPVMLWKPATPVYPKLIQEAPEGLTKFEAANMIKKGKKLLPICKLAKNGIYITLVKDVRDAFEEELVPCVLLSFDDEQILTWRGKEWKSMYPEAPPTVPVRNHSNDSASVNSGELHSANERLVPELEISGPKFLSRWKRAIESSKALLLDEIELGPDELLEKVEAFAVTLQAAEHSYPALITSSGKVLTLSDDDDEDDDSEYDDSEYGYEDQDYSFEELDSSIPKGSLPVDVIVDQLTLE